MASFEARFVAHFETAPRRRGISSWGTKEFKTKWEAEKYLYDYQQSHWYASLSGWVDSYVVDNRTAHEKHLSEKSMETVARYASKWNGF